MKLFAIFAAVIATLSTSSMQADARSLAMNEDSGDKPISAYCLFDKDMCEGEIRLRYYLPGNGSTELGSSSNSVSVCSLPPPPGCDTVQKDKFSVMKTCASDVVEDSKKHISADFVVVKFYKDEGEECSTEAWDSALAVTSDDKCYPSIDNKKSYRVVYNSSDKSVKWTSYGDNSKCEGTGESVTFSSSDLNGKKCLPGRLQAIYVQQETDSSAPTPAPSSTAANTAGLVGFGWFLLSYFAVDQL